MDYLKLLKSGDLTSSKDSREQAIDLIVNCDNNDDKIRVVAHLIHEIEGLKAKEKHYNPKHD